MTNANFKASYIYLGQGGAYKLGKTQEGEVYLLCCPINADGSLPADDDWGEPDWDFCDDLDEARRALNWLQTVSQ